MLAAIGGHYGWPKADLEALTADEVAFWTGAAAELNRRADQAAGRG